MTQDSQHIPQSQKRPGMIPERMNSSRSTLWKGAQKERLSCKQLERIFEALPDGVLVCDKEGKIIRINAAALKLFEVPSPVSWQGKSSQQFLQDYQPTDLCQQPTSVKPWFMNVVCDNAARSDIPEQKLMLHLPSGQEIYVKHWCIPFFDARMHTLGAFSVFHDITHRYQKALHLQHVHEATSTLTDAIAHLPCHIDLTASAETPLLSAPVTFVAQQLVNLIRQVLQCRRVSLVAFGPSDHDYLVAGSGLTPEQEQYWQHIKGQVLPVREWVNETALARLSTHQEVILSEDDIRSPFPFHPTFSTENLLLTPLFLEQEWVGMLVIVKAGPHNEYTPEEVELVKAVTEQTALIIECLCQLRKEVEIHTRGLLQHEIHHLCNDFLSLASHELLTPLTAIFGNIQLAQRRLAALKRHSVEKPEQVHDSIEHLQHPLASASWSAALQKRIINDLIDDAQIQINHLKLRMNHIDLLTLLKDAVFKQQQAVSEYMIVLKVPSTEQSVPIFADAERITRVLNTYLVNALSHSPGQVPVTVQLVVTDAEALISVHDEGPGIPLEEQEHLWERFYRAKGSAVQHELDLSLGLGFYLCRALIEYHHGRVGVQSTPGNGETFWFTLPVVASSKE